MAKNRRNISERDAQKLYLFSGNQCAKLDCKNEIFSDNIAKIGEIAHIVGLNKGSERHDGRCSEKNLNSYDNLILLCSNCHEEVDDKDAGGKYTKEILLTWKIKHENKYSLSFRKFIGVETLVQWGDSHLPEYPEDYKKACETLGIDPLDDIWLKNNLEYFIEKLAMLSFGVRSTLYLILKKGFNFDIGLKSPLLNPVSISYPNFITNLDKDSREEAVSHIKCLVDEGWISLDAAYLHEEDASLSFCLVYRQDEIDSIWKLLLNEFKSTDSLENMICNLKFKF